MLFNGPGGGSSAGEPPSQAHPDAISSSASATAPRLELGATMLDGDESLDGDVTVALARLNYNIENVTKQMREQVTTHAPALLAHASSISNMEGGLKDVRNGLGELEGGVERLRAKVRTPYQHLRRLHARLSRLHAASDLLRRAGRFAQLARRLDAQMDVVVATEAGGEDTNPAPGTIEQAKGKGKSKEDLTETEREEALGRELAKAALTISELDSLLSQSPVSSPPASPSTGAKPPGKGNADPPGLPSPPLTALSFVRTYLSVLEEARRGVNERMEDMIVRGLKDLSPTLLSSALQIANNLGSLPDLVRDLLSDLTEVVRDRIRAAFDMTSLAKEVGGKEPIAQSAANAYIGYKIRSRNEPTNVLAPQWAAALWKRLDSLIVGEMAGVCMKVYALEKVLRLKQDQGTQLSFLEEAMKVLENKPSVIFWKTFAQAFESHSKEAAKSSAFVQQTLTTNYAKLVRLFQDFFSKVAVTTDTDQQSPETVLVLRSIAHFASA